MWSSVVIKYLIVTVFWTVAPYSSKVGTIILEDSAILIFVVEEGGGTRVYQWRDVSSHTILLLLCEPHISYSWTITVNYSVCKLLQHVAELLFIYLSIIRLLHV
jgi:hypothetical protein